MLGRAIRISPQRQFICDLVKAAQRVPTIPVQRRMNLARLAAARMTAPLRPSWLAIFTKAYAQVAQAVPELRRACVHFPRPHLYEYPCSTASIAFEREYQGEKAVFIGRIKDPAQRPLEQINLLIRGFQEGDIETCKDFRKGLQLSRLPALARRVLWWLILNVGRQRGNYLGTFGVTAYSALGAESLHPLSPLTTTLTYGVLAPNGEVDVRIVYDHRVMDGATVARALRRLETELNEGLVAELHALHPKSNLLGALDNPLDAAA
jgi:hypothetical protein